LGLCARPWEGGGKGVVRGDKDMVLGEGGELEAKGTALGEQLCKSSTTNFDDLKKEIQKRGKVFQNPRKI